MKLHILYFITCIIFFGCKKNIEEPLSSENDGCLISREVLVNSSGKVYEEHTYTHNKNKIITKKSTFSDVDGVRTNTFSYQYNSDGQLTKILSKSYTQTFKYNNKLLVEDKYEQGGETLLLKYFYNSNSQKSKVLMTNTKNNSIYAKEFNYEYQDTLLVKVLSKTLEPDLYNEGTIENIYKYNKQNLLIESIELDKNKKVITTINYAYNDNSNKILERTSWYNSNGGYDEIIYLYNSSKLIEKTSYSVKSDNRRAIYDKKVYEYVDNKIFKINNIINDKISGFTQFDYICY